MDDAKEQIEGFDWEGLEGRFWERMEGLRRVEEGLVGEWGELGEVCLVPFFFSLIDGWGCGFGGGL